MNTRPKILMAIFATIGVASSGAYLATSAYAQQAGGQKQHEQQGHHENEGQEGDENETLTAQVNIGQAVQAANGRVQGYVNEAKLESENNRVQWEVKVITAQGAQWDVEVDATTGTVIRAEQDAPDGAESGERED